MNEIPRIRVAKALFTPIVDGQKQEPFQVHFNPVSLQYSVSNTLKEEGNGKQKKQYVTKVSGKLTMDLIFDNTGDGQSVQITTAKLAVFMGSPDKDDKDKKQVPPILLFEWGGYSFQGMMESYKETLDFFSPEGVPLRASVNISLAQQTQVFSSSSSDTQRAVTPDAVDLPTGNGGGGPGGSQNAQSAATVGGDPNAARGLAALNGEASVRFSTGASLTVNGSIQLGPPVAFATGISAGAGAGVGISGGAGIGVGGGGGIGIGGSGGAGIGGSASAGIGIGVSGAAGIGISGSSASAGVSAADGAFAGLRVSTQAPSFALNTNNFLLSTPSLPLATGSNASFQVGGQATIAGTTGLTADVGAAADLRARIQFEG